ncbi:hypothetical protein DFH06DRAFT_1131134 [Mycena polygramma]|nr:hypothetical protein DFH06DRAFT_1131134 [Mycena polygramma]
MPPDVMIPTLLLSVFLLQVALPVVFTPFHARGSVLRRLSSASLPPATSAVPSRNKDEGCSPFYPASHASGASSNSIGTPSNSAALPSLSGVSSCGGGWFSQDATGATATNCLAMAVNADGCEGVAAAADCFCPHPAPYVTSFLTCLTAYPSEGPATEALVERFCAAAATPTSVRFGSYNPNATPSASLGSASVSSGSRTASGSANASVTALSSSSAATTSNAAARGMGRTVMGGMAMGGIGIGLAVADRRRLRLAWFASAASVSVLPHPVRAHPRLPTPDPAHSSWPYLRILCIASPSISQSPCLDRIFQHFPPVVPTYIPHRSAIAIPTRIDVSALFSLLFLSPYLGSPRIPFLQRVLLLRRGYIHTCFCGEEPSMVLLVNVSPPAGSNCAPPKSRHAAKLEENKNRAPGPVATTNESSFSPMAAGGVEPPSPQT